VLVALVEEVVLVALVDEVVLDAFELEELVVGDEDPPQVYGVGPGIT